MDIQTKRNAIKFNEVLLTARESIDELLKKTDGYVINDLIYFLSVSVLVTDLTDDRTQTEEFSKEVIKLFNEDKLINLKKDADILIERANSIIIQDLNVEESTKVFFKSHKPLLEKINAKQIYENNDYVISLGTLIMLKNLDINKDTKEGLDLILSIGVSEIQELALMVDEVLFKLFNDLKIKSNLQ